MNNRTRRCFLALALLLAVLCLPPPAQAQSALAELIASLQASERFEPDRVAAVYRETVLTGAGIDRAVARLRAYARAGTLSPQGQAASHLAIAHLQWRDGAIEDAVLSSDLALESSPTREALLLKARLLDAGGDEDAAREWYQRAAEAYDEGDEQWLIRVRLAMMDVSSRNVEVLEELASQRDQSFRNQAAVVLALLGRPERAIELYQPLPGAARLYRQYLRLSEWALSAGSHELAREQAWLAYADAPVRVDRLYALSLLAESYRSADELALLLADLATRDPADQDLLRLRVETLIETEDYPQALELYGQLEGSEADIAERRRLVSLYEAAGDTDAMVSEYRRMMDAEPAQPQWYDGLAAHYLNVADNDAALAVWETFQERNGERAGVLVEGGRLMVAMGFVDESVAMIERHLQAHGPDVGALLFLFETWLDRGDDEPALDALERLEEFLPPDAAELVELADAYERLSRPQEALRVFEAIRDVRGELGYDDQMRLAWLYTIVDRKTEALDLWRDIWVGVESPARRSFAESQLLLLAAELSALGDMAVELEGMLMLGTANRNHMNLLVRIYVESGDKLSATEIIDEYAESMGEDAIGHQQLLAHVYMLLEDYPAHDQALRRLYEIDPDNRLDHIQSIILNLLTFDLATGTNERLGEIQRWIEELRTYDEEAVTGEFEASIFSTAGFVDQAVEAYRRALVEQPENSDNLLLLADVMDNNGQTDEAVAILQFFAENAVEDNDFVVAVDGVLNLIGTTTFFQQPDPETLDTLAWTRRVILERIASRANRFYLYELLADIAREQGDTEASFLALENSLAEAGLRRPAVLRELLTMATPNTGFGGFSTGTGDIDRQLRYGRRLVGLRQQLPPEVYIDVGKSLLAREDVSGAERAFEMIDDITGMIDIDRTKAEMFEEAGYDEQSRVFYNRALNVNRDSLELLHKTGFLYEVIGREDVAFERYMQAIGDVLRRQSTILAAGARPVDPNSWQAIMNQRTDTTVSREYREHYASLEQGLLLSWPEGAEESEAAAAELKALFETELRNVLDRTEDELLPLARYARLDRTARLVRTVGFFLDDRDLAQYADRRLLAHFGDDADFAEHLIAAYGAAGRPLPAGVTVDDDALGAMTPLRSQLVLAGKREDFETQLQLLRLAGAFDEMETLLGERILDGEFTEGLGYALGLLGKPEFRRLALATSSKLLEERDAFKALVGSNADLLIRAEEVAGQPLVPPEEVVALLLDPGAGAEPASPFGFNDNSGYWQYLEERGSTQDRIRFLQAEVEGAGSDGNAGIFFPGSDALSRVRPLLKEELTAAQRSEVADTVIEYLSGLETNDDSVFYTVAQAMMIVDGRRENAEVLYRVADYVRNRWPNMPDVRPFLEAIYAGRSDEAFRLIVEMEENLPSPQGFPVRFFAPGLNDALEAASSELLDRIAAGEEVPLDLARAAYEREYSSRFFYRPPTMDRLDRQDLVLDRLAALDPDPSRYRADRISVWLNLGYADRAGKAIAEEYRSAPDDAAWRLAHFLFFRSQQRFGEALEVVSDGGADLSDPAVMQQVMARQTRAPGAVGAIIRQLQTMQPVEEDSGSVSAGSGLLVLGGPQPQSRRKGPVERLGEALNAGDHEEGQRALREAWRSLLTPRNSPYARPPGSTPLTFLASGLLNTPMPEPGKKRSTNPSGGFFSGVAYIMTPAGMSGSSNGRAMGEKAPERRMLFDAIAEAPYGEAELDAFLRAIPDGTRTGFRQLYEYLAKASADGRRLEDLWNRLNLQEITDHEFTLWMMLRDEQRIEFGPGGLQAFEDRLAAVSNPSPYQLLLAARVLATAGAVDRSVDYYKLVAARRIEHNEYGDQERFFYGFYGGQSSPANLLELIGEVAQRLPSEAAREVLDAVALLARPAKEMPAYDMLFDAFLIASLEKVYSPEEVFVQARRRSPAALDLPERLYESGALKAAELARAFARAGDLARATEILGAMLTEAGPPALTPEEQMDMRLRFSAQAASALSLLYGLPAVTQRYQYQDQGYTAAQEVLRRQMRLFPMGEDEWPGMPDWVAAATDMLLDLVASRQVEQYDALRLLVPLGMRQLRAEEPAQDVGLMARILQSIEAGGRPLSAEGLVLLASLAEAGGGSLQFDRVAGILEEGRLPWKERLTLLGLYQDSDEGAQLLELVRANGLDSGLGVLRVLQTIAERIEDSAYVAELQERIEREEAAEKELTPDEEEETQAVAMAIP